MATYNPWRLALLAVILIMAGSLVSADSNTATQTILLSIQPAVAVWVDTTALASLDTLTLNPDGTQTLILMLLSFPNGEIEPIISVSFDDPVSASVRAMRVRRSRVISPHAGASRMSQWVVPIEARVKNIDTVTVTVSDPDEE